MSETINNVIDGTCVASRSDTFIALIDPTTGIEDGRSPVSLTEEVDAAFAAAERAFLTWGRTTPSHRQDRLLALADLVAAHREELVSLQSRDTGQLLRTSPARRSTRESTSSASSPGPPACWRGSRPASTSPVTPRASDASRSAWSRR